jgi:hypothetical protein
MTMVEFLSDAAMVIVCAAAAVGCFVVNQRVRRLASSERGIGKAVSDMARSVTEFETLLAAAEASTREASAILDDQLDQARKLVARLSAIAGAATHPASAPPATAGKVAEPGDPLADVVPKGASLANGAGKRSIESGSAPSERPLKRLADLAQQRKATSSSGAAGPVRSAQA